MKQKYSIMKDPKTQLLTIQEFAELSKDIFSMVCEESYLGDTIITRIGEGKKELIETLRTPNLYPASEYIDKIADTVITLYQSDDADADSVPVELVFDDIDSFTNKAAAEEEEEEEEEEEAVEIDDLLEDENDDDS